MLPAPTDFHHRQPFLPDAYRLLATAQALLAPSRVLVALVARGKARAEARAAAAVTYEAPPVREGGHGTTDPINDFAD